MTNLLFLSEANIQLSVNAKCGLWDNGRALPSLVRGRILDLSHQGLVQRAIAREVRTSTFVGNVSNSYAEIYSSIRIPRANFAESKIDPDVLAEYTEVQKHIKPSTYASEIQHSSLLGGVVHPNALPGTPQINRHLREDLFFSKKKLRVCPLKAEKPGVLDLQNEYLQAISRYLASNLNFFEQNDG